MIKTKKLTWVQYYSLNYSLYSDFTTLSTIVLFLSQDPMRSFYGHISLVSSSVQWSQSFFVSYDLNIVFWRVLILYFAEWILDSHPSGWVYLMFSYQYTKIIHFWQECHAIDVSFSVDHIRSLWSWYVICVFNVLTYK